MDKNYGGVIWTNHAMERLRERGISQGDAWATFRRPDQSRYAKSKGSWIYYKTYPTSSRFRGASGERIEVVAKQNEKREWLILSVWSKPEFKDQELAKNNKGLGLINFIKKIFFNR
jgi:hypothetical protein